MAKVSSRPRRWGRFLAWTSLVFGILFAIVGLVMPETLFMLLFGLVFVIPGAWWIISDRRDQKQWDRYEETVENNRRLATMIGDDNPDIVAGMGGRGLAFEAVASLGDCLHRDGCPVRWFCSARAQTGNHQ